ncbi:unnamed protein product [Brachionus calyciflorus]|uniref:Uncharacterized protein n=1 Tax=Brachionus calyciflorus TaxID=104777 RepID=A0A814GB93_9BILA|nr:unnamed protein product [Brachionus calyciflorus]
MDPDSIEKTAFSTPDGLEFVEVYLEDITIHSETLEQHIRQLQIVFKKLRDARLKINGNKCIWCSRSINVLGHTVTKDTVMMDPRKVEAIKNMQRPTNIKQLQSFLGLSNYYRRFIQNFSKNAHPMFALLGKNVKFIWSDECEQSFNMIKDALTSYPVLRLADVNRPFLLYTDASGYPEGAFLAQVVDNGKEYVVAYTSRLMTKHEINYVITEKECLAVIFGIKTFRNYLHGVNFKVITDHSALACYDCEIIHRKGVNHSNVDAFSRPVESINFTTNTVVEDTSAKSLDPWEDESLIHYLKFGRFIPGTSKKQIKSITSLVQKYLYQNEKLYVTKDDHTLEIPKPEERLPINEKVHALGHFRAESTYNGLKDNFYWKRMLDDIRKAINQCLPCQRNNKMIVNYHSAKALKVRNVFDRIQIDLVLGLMKTPDGYIRVSNKENWPKYLDYVLMAYRSRFHSVTKFTHFELMFGRKMNVFEVWTSSNENDESEAIIARNLEIRNMIENSQTTAKENIEEAQKRQVSIQNKAQHTTIEKIPIGKTV